MKKKLLSIFFIFTLLFTFLTACAQGDAQSKKYGKNKNTTNISSNIKNQQTKEQEKSKNKNEKNTSKKDNLSKNQKDSQKNAKISIDENKSYTSKDDVAVYIHTYKKLPSNYITKSDARNKGWDSSKGNLDKVLKGKSIGGDKFSNREKLLPTKKDRQYYECDIDYKGGKRNAKRILYSNDGLVYYTDDHYKTFTLLYGAE